MPNFGRILGLLILLVTACSRIAGIGDEFRAGDASGGADDALFDSPGLTVDTAVLGQRAYIKALSAH